jgi:two-component system response regulator GlrR
MTRSKLLLFDFNPAGTLGGLLRLVLESTPPPGVDPGQEPPELFCTASDGATETVPELSPDLVFLVLGANPVEQVGSFFRGAAAKAANVPVIVVTESCNPEEMFKLLKLGATDFISAPLEAVDILPRVWRLLDQTGREQSLARTLKKRIGLKQLVGRSQTFLSEVEKIPLIAGCDASVLISGETGTGKEVCARAIHYLGPRASKPFVPVNCGAIPLELVENELFGHERGAYTGALTAELGLIHEADGGTLFLDEIDCLPPPAQVKLLRFLQEKEYRPLGSAKTLKSNVRVMAATNVNPEKALSEGVLRRDLYYRLNIIPLNLPPLRERREDIILLARHFLAKYNDEFDKKVADFSPDAAQALVHYAWPGNVRELEHVVERAVALCERGLVGGCDVVLPEPEKPLGRESFRQLKAKAVAQFEKTYIQELLSACDGNITRAAQMAFKNRRAFWQLIRKYQINVRAFKVIS